MGHLKSIRAKAFAQSGVLRIRLRLPCPRSRGLVAWGDYHFGMSLADALKRRGHRVSITYALRPKWRSSRFMRFFHRVAEVCSTALVRPQIDIVLRGKARLQASRRRISIMWLISNSASLSDGEIRSFDHVFVTSTQHEKKLRACGHSNVSLLLQCTDSERFHPRPPIPALETYCLFVGNKRGFERMSVVHALRAKLDLKVWGRKWQGLIPPEIWAGKGIENVELAKHYASAKLVLNDHAPDMAQDGFTSNRVFDVLACAAPLLTDCAVDLPA